MIVVKEDIVNGTGEDMSQEIVKVLLVSGGRESIAAGIKMTPEYFDERVFADTGDDPKGLATIEHLNRYHNWNITVIRSKYFPIVDYYQNIHVEDKKDKKLSGHAMPFQAQKDCSSKFKIQPIRNYLREKYGKKVHFEISYGFSFSKKEVKRKHAVEKYKISYATYKFPLIDMKIDRNLCGEICKNYLGFVPEPTLCDMCFERTQPEWREFFKKYPEKAKAIMEFEESSHVFKVFGFGLNNVPLRKLFNLEPLDEAQKTLFDTFTDEKLEEIANTEELVKSVSIGCACMQDAHIFEEDE